MLPVLPLFDGLALVMWLTQRHDASVVKPIKKKRLLGLMPLGLWKHPVL